MEQERDELHSWEQLEELVQGADPQQVESFLDTLTTGEAARAVSRLSEEDQTRLLSTLSPAEAADLMEELPDAQAAELIDLLPPEQAAAIVNELASDEQADLLGDLEPPVAAAILARMDPEEAADARRLVSYEDEVAGGLMVTEYLAYAQTATVADVVADMRAHREVYEDYDVQYGYIVDDVGRLVGVLRLRDLLLARPERRMGELMIREPMAVSDLTPLDELAALFDRHSFFGVPVVDGVGRLLGVVRRVAVEEALAERSEDDYRKSQGIVGEELRTLPVLRRAARRLSWLSVNIVLNVVAASVIAFYQDTLAAVIALAVFLPIISDMSGCSGNQAVAVSMRELSLGLVKPREALRVWGQELSVGLLNGAALGLLLGGVAWAWKGNPFLGLVVGAALMLNTLVAVSIGGTVPLVLKRFRLDPALASGPILTTITDLCGFFLVLSFAASMLPRLT